MKRAPLAGVYLFRAPFRRRNLADPRFLTNKNRPRARRPHRFRPRRPRYGRIKENLK